LILAPGNTGVSLNTSSASKPLTAAASTFIDYGDAPILGARAGEYAIFSHPVVSFWRTERGVFLAGPFLAINQWQKLWICSKPTKMIATVGIQLYI
jgi:hypothetical protein